MIEHIDENTTIVTNDVTSFFTTSLKRDVILRFTNDARVCVKVGEGKCLDDLGEALVSNFLWKIKKVEYTSQGIQKNIEKLYPCLRDIKK